MTIERVHISSTDEWLTWRPHWIGTSEIGIVCGESSYGSLAELYAEKKGLKPPLADSAIFRRGRWGEAAVFQALAEERPEWGVRRARVHVRDTDHKLACTPDAFALAPDHDGIGLLEGKVISRSVIRQKWLDDPDDSIIDGPMTPPASYRLQLAGGMRVNDCRWGALVVLIVSEFDWRLRILEYERDPVLEDRILRNADVFWRQYMDPGIMPPFEPQRDAELVRLLYPKDNGTEIDLAGDNRALALVDEWTEVGTARKSLEKAEKAIKTELQGKIGEHTYGRLVDGRRLSWKQQHRKAHTVEASDFRVLRLLDNKED